MQKPLLQELITRLQTDDLTGVEIKRALGKDAKASGHISGVLLRAAKHCPELLEKRGGGKWALISPKVSTISFMEIYNSRKGKNLSPIHLDTRTIEVPTELPPDLHKTSFIRPVMENLVEDLPKELNLKITIEGSIKITFSLEK